MTSSDILADIGNSYFHIYNGKTVEHLSYIDAINRYKNQKLYYISVQHKLKQEIKQIENWRDISDLIHIKNEYSTMGIDRKALCLNYRDGIFIDAGSAITIDIMEDGIYQGGFILLGLKAYLNGYKNISLALDIELNKQIDLERLPTTTKDGISYAIIASIKAIIDKSSSDKNLYFTGGDGEFLSTFFKKAIYDEMLVFNGMQKVIKDAKIC